MMIALDRLAPTYEGKYASARRFLARLASGTFLTGLKTGFFNTLIQGRVYNSKFGGRAEIIQRAGFAVWFSRVADSAAVKDQAVRESGPLFRRQKLHEILFDPVRVLLFSQTEAARQPLAMSIDDDSGDSEGVA